ncbi:MarR family winged helix-turn-helix transcriptional regulator [Clostridium beijerinckii]|uniref:Organic hydroperoxide resistance transcriptional regulator n=1 Tax=Clostridium beijerinckii TaxID=1520 RepID=A0A1S8S0X8_CLOBE|nr:MarR family transcriptional regulator [Clostridium beijerinckii]NRY63005.1 DNA-binding MarR family transcriptional regulator [Clostridium beijerinckii]OOM59108.1 organic hydroperoxide resistance transcriptional regulator [Clostridium beijerinckii]
MEIINESIEVSRLFQEVMSLFRLNMKKIIEHTGMTAPQGMVIGLLHKNKKMKVTELSKQLHLPNSTVSGIIDKLEEQEAVIRERSEDDKRVVYVSISPKFIEMHKNFNKQIEHNIESILNQGTQEELNKISEGLIIFKRLLSENNTN